ncbi:LysM peptidoglycan-binding domain-containing protein [Phycicoccus sp. CSK15P-2]|uniref:LysM peptidoglycan-binding domain-containing protein n=1 Tax=Phycicoccus sp. CSK15P-2 TaxID=2807627 RepID=UPI001950B0C1|nr:LysM peptidoglycan-binding domain-containing protein [Phycicoccus sp. CSK15P-2]MBM6404393.1 LysM peptidoglycan-binding domain-containing protein [Phycicoccus sp. CSK15P-2]
MRPVGAAAAMVVPAVIVLVLWRTLREVTQTALTGAPLQPADALLGLAAGLGLLLLGWLVLGTLLEGLARVPGRVGLVARRVSAAVSPRIVRQVAAAVIGLGVGAGAGGAHAAPAPVTAVAPQAPSPAGTSTSTSTPLPDPGWADTPDPGWTPAPPTVRPQADLTVLGSRAHGATTDEVVVRRGDSLWAIAARHLGEGATDAEVAEAWPRWHAANRAVVGPDPDLLRPGQVLRVPEAATR